MNVLKSILFAAVTVVAVSASADTEVYFGNNSMQDIPSCGPNARAKAVYDNQGNKVLRVCDAVTCTAGKVLINTNIRYEESGDGKTQYITRLDAWATYGACSDIPLVKYGYNKQRVLIQSGSGQTQGRIVVEGVPTF